MPKLPHIWEHRRSRETSVHYPTKILALNPKTRHSSRFEFLNKGKTIAEENTLEHIKIDGSNLWKEENYTDLQVGSIRVLTPIKIDGSVDEGRTAT